MYLQYGVSDTGELVYIDQVRRGATGLHCPYCGGLLLAKKGAIKAHHFAHAGETCRQAQRDEDTLALPCYDNFNLHLPGRDLAALQDFHGENYTGLKRDRLEALDLITFNKFAGRGGSWELTKRGKVPFGELSLMLFNEFQEPLLVERHDKLEAVAAAAYARPQLEARLAEIDAEARPMLAPSGQFPIRREDGPRLAELNDELWAVRGKLKAITMDFETAITDLRLYRAQLRRILSCSLYFLEVQPLGLYKIGVTTRAIQDRLGEIEADLRREMGSQASGIKFTLTPLGIWPARGNVELYFKHRYSTTNHPIGPLTEYFKFEDVAPVLRDLRRMKPKELTPLEQAILRGDLSPLEEQIRLDEVERRRRAGIRMGMQKAHARGKHIGRPASTDEAFLAKPEHVAAWEALQAKQSLRQAAATAGIAVNTVRKIQKLRQVDEA